MTKWRMSDSPPGAGRSAIVTGTGGIGLEGARALVRLWDSSEQLVNARFA